LKKGDSKQIHNADPQISGAQRLGVSGKWRLGFVDLSLVRRTRRTMKISLNNEFSCIFFQAPEQAAQFVK
jgi:hypothetical protein